VELMRGDKSIASVRAAPGGPVELLALHHEAFMALLQASPLTEEALARIVQHRIAENRAAGKLVK
jgi:CRP-like cAMP-binding protein